MRTKNTNQVKEIFKHFSKSRIFLKGYLTTLSPIACSDVSYFFSPIHRIFNDPALILQTEAFLTGNQTAKRRQKSKQRMLGDTCAKEEENFVISFPNTIVNL